MTIALASLLVAVPGIITMAAPMALMLREYERQGLITGPYDAPRKVFHYRWLTEGIRLTPRDKRVRQEIAEGAVPTQTVASSTAGGASSTDAFVVAPNR